MTEQATEILLKLFGCRPGQSLYLFLYRKPFRCLFSAHVTAQPLHKGTENANFSSSAIAPTFSAAGSGR